MSSYYMILKHRKSGEEHRIFAIDDYFRSHVYGYKVPNGDVLTGDELVEMYYPRNVELVRTCQACPEQYDAFKNGERVGYLRLRHGCFIVEYPDCGGEEIYSAEPKGDGIFEDHEREFYLDQAVEAIRNKLKESQS